VSGDSFFNQKTRGITVAVNGW